MAGEGMEEKSQAGTKTKYRAVANCTTELLEEDVK